MTLVVEHNYAFGIPQTDLGAGFDPRAACWHWTAGGPGRAGWDGTVRHLIVTRGTVNASYHGGLWHEHNPPGCITILQWIVPTTNAAHSLAPNQAFVLHPGKDAATQHARFAEVRRILGYKAADPNAGLIAISYAGMPEDMAAAMTCEVFRADARNLARQLEGHPKVIDDRPHFGHGWIQPASRYETDTPAGDLVAMLYGQEPAGPAPTPVEEVITMRLRVHAVEWNVPDGTPFWTQGPGVGEQKAFDGAQIIDSIAREIAPDGSAGPWIVARINREFVWVNRANVTPTVPGGDPAYDAAVYKVIELGAAALGGTITGITEAEAKKREDVARAAGRTEGIEAARQDLADTQ